MSMASSEGAPQQQLPRMLSICIATRNRCAMLVETLANIRAQLDDRVEVVVVDGASTDATPQVLARLVGEEPRVRYFFEAQNGGIDRDYDRAVSYASGEYCWLMSDDDLLKPDAVATVLAACAKAYAFIFVDAEVRSLDFSQLLKARRTALQADRIYASNELEALFDDTADALSFIGSTVIRRDVWMSRAREPYFGSEFVHVGVIFQSRLPGAALAIAEPLVEIRYGNASWSARSFDIWMRKWPRLIWSFADISPEAKRRVVHQQPWRQPMELLRWRGKGAYSIAEYHRLLTENDLGPMDRLLMGAIAAMPDRMVDVLASIYVRCFARNKGMAAVNRQTAI